MPSMTVLDLRCPHACGGEPAYIPGRSMPVVAVPTLVGVNRIQVRKAAEVAYAVPTLVGVNRY